MFDLFREISQTLSHNKLRTALTGLAVAWGIFMLMTLLAAANGVTTAFRDNMLGPDSQKLSIWGGQTSKPYHGYREGRSINLKDADLALVADENKDYAAQVNSTISGGWSTMSTPTTFIRAGFDGVYPSTLVNSSRISLRDGRYINDNDVATTAKVIVLSERYASQLFPPDGAKAVGSRVNVGGISFKVVGVYTARWGRENYVPYSTARLMSENKDQIGNMTVYLKNVSTEADGEAAENAVRQTLAGAHEFDHDDSSALWVRNEFVDGIKGLKAMNILNLGVWLLGILTLLTGIVGISNIMFVSVRERTHEIGVRRAIGARPRSILIQIIAEAVAITTLFGYIGIVAGTIASELLARNFANNDFIKDPHVSLALAIEVTAVLIISGALAGLFPALRSLKIKPVEALRDE